MFTKQINANPLFFKCFIYSTNNLSRNISAQFSPAPQPSWFPVQTSGFWQHMLIHIERPVKHNKVKRMDLLTGV